MFDPMMKMAIDFPSLCPNREQTLVIEQKMDVTFALKVLLYPHHLFSHPFFSHAHVHDYDDCVLHAMSNGITNQEPHVD